MASDFCPAFLALDAPLPELPFLLLRRYSPSFILVFCLLCLPSHSLAAVVQNYNTKPPEGELNHKGIQYKPGKNIEVDVKQLSSAGDLGSNPNQAVVKTAAVHDADAADDNLHEDSGVVIEEAEDDNQKHHWKVKVIIGCTVAVAIEICIVIVMVVYWKQIRWTMRKLTCPCDERYNGHEAMEPSAPSNSYPLSTNGVTQVVHSPTMNRDTQVQMLSPLHQTHSEMPREQPLQTSPV